jgi:hypothetical protein
MDYQHAINLLHEARVYRPAVVELGGTFHVFSRTELLGSGATIERAMRASGHYPLKARASPGIFSVAGTNVMQGDVSVCVARSRNTATRIANALNEYQPSPRGF